MTDSPGNIVNKYAYDAFGKVISQTQTISNPFKYAGRFGVMDDGSGLLYMRARYYDPSVGRFINKDPIGLLGGINMYAYVGNNPVNGIDPLGLWSISIESYYGWGGGIVFGKNPGGGSFITFRGGYGIGGGVSYNPNGSSPGWDPCNQNHGLNVGIGGYAGANVGLGPVYSGINGNAGANVAYQSFNPYLGFGLEYGLDWGWYLRGGVATGIEIVLY